MVSLGGSSLLTNLAMLDTLAHCLMLVMAITVRGSIDEFSTNRSWALPIQPIWKVLMHEHVFVLGEELRQNYPDYPEPWDEEVRVADAVAKLTEAKSAESARSSIPQ